MTEVRFSTTVSDIVAPVEPYAMEDEDEDSLEEIQSCFSLFDKRGDLKVESHRVIDVLRSLGLNPLTEDVDKCLKDSNLVGTRVDFPTFYGIFQQMYRMPTMGTYEDIVEGLKTLDRDQTGSISSAELRHLLIHVGDKMTEEQVLAILAPHEGASGSVAYEALIQTVMQGH